MGFSDVYLTDRENRQLMAMSDGSVAFGPETEFDELIRRGFADHYSHGVGFVITPNGMRYCEYLEEMKAERSRRIRNETFARRCAYFGAITGGASLIWQILSRLVK